MKLNGKVAVITGGAQGIGAAIALRFAREGAIVIIGDMNEEVGKATAERINASIGMSGERVLFIPLSVTDGASIESFVSSVASGGRIDILVNNAGITRDKTFVKMSQADFEAVMEVNFNGPVKMTRAIIPMMIKQGSGVILSASSVVAPGNFGQANYAASKAALKSFTRTLAKELGPKGIRVNAVAPGFTKTAMTDGMPEEALAAVCKSIHLRRMATPEEIADAYLYLATATYVTGTTLAVDGGLSV
jgi:3-oxoacyl-[acyl-carrier protein] reductase